jgi:hypothetical protein
MKKYIIAEVKTHSGRKEKIKKNINDHLIDRWSEYNDTSREPLVRELKEFVLDDYQTVYRSICTDNWFVWGW